MTEKELYQKALVNIVGFTEEFGRWLYAHHIKLPAGYSLATFSAKGLDDMLQTANTEQLERACARTLNSYWAARRWMIGKIGLGAANSVMDFTERDKKACQLGMVWLNGIPGGMPFRTIAGVKICGDEPTLKIA